MTTVTALRAGGLSAGYHGVPAVSGVDLEVGRGEMVALLGANGAGKTTTLLALVGQVQILSGTVEMLGHIGHATLQKRVRSGLGLITERRCVFMGLTCRENLLLGRGSVDTALGFFPELEERLDTKAGLLSGGEQQMLALGRILAAEPRLILADEVSLGLAPLIVKRLLVALREAAERGTGVLLVEQQPTIALRTVDRAYVLRLGRVVLEGDAGHLRQRLDDVLSLYL